MGKSLTYHFKLFEPTEDSKVLSSRGVETIRAESLKDALNQLAGRGVMVTGLCTEEAEKRARGLTRDDIVELYGVKDRNGRTEVLYPVHDNIGTPVTLAFF